jgi:phage terminase large subunit GpA-like protein
MGETRKKRGVASPGGAGLIQPDGSSNKSHERMFPFVYGTLSTLKKLCGVSRSTAYQWIEEGKIISKLIGGRRYNVSSPVELEQCRITELFEASTREKYHAKCPLCSHLQILRLPEMDFESVTCRCLACGQSFGQDDWQAEKGEWIAKNPGVPRRGFWLNAFVSPFVRWEVIFAEWREACHRREEGDKSLFRVVLATRLAENFVEHVEKMSEPEILLSRREQYPAEVPDAAKVVVAAVDTQQTWLEYLVAAAGARGELWCLETGTIEGRIETDAASMYEEIDHRLFSRKWKRPDGRSMMITRALQDSGGHATGVVYKMCMQRARVLMAYRGSHDLVGPWKRGTDAAAHARLI